MDQKEENSPATEPVKAARDNTPSPAYAKFMSEGWVASDLEDVVAGPAVTSAFIRRATLSARYPGMRLVLPAGGFKVRSNDTDYRFRPHSAFAYYSGVQGVEASADAVLILEPRDDGHETFLFIHPRSTRDTHAFYTDRRYGELWVGRRFTLSEAERRYQIQTRSVDELEAILKDGTVALTIRGQDPMVDKNIAVHPHEADFLSFTSAARLIKDEYEISELQRACDETIKGFSDVVRALPAAVSTPRGERVVEAAFFGRARIAGNDVGYETIAASGSHACVLHWVQNDGEVRPGELILIDAGIEMDSYYTADITRTLPISGKFSPAQRALYTWVYEAQLAGFAAVKPGATFRSVNAACQAVLAKGLWDMGVLPMSPEESLLPENGLHRRWTLHGVSHMLGMDVHDCDKARDEDYVLGTLKEGMVLTVE
uniref:aminopeptidase P family protein n=1 Tax=Candidatus Planktophila sp. TaxID=2175601 RepID=UPI00404AE450